MKKKIIGILIFSAAFLFVMNFAYASGVNYIQPASVIMYDEALDVDSSIKVSLPSYFLGGMHVGQQVVGGVSYLQGTIINTTTGSNGSDVPVTIGDNLRVDGFIQRGEMGSGDNMPVKINDDVWVAGNISMQPGMSVDGIDISELRVNDWNSAYGWGDHSTAGYLTVETDPVYGASAASTIALGDITNWNTAYGWGDHSVAGYLTSYTETDPIHVAWLAANPNIDLDSTDDFTPSTLLTDYGFTDNSGNWNTAYGWGNHSLAGYLTSYTETDPVYGASAASTIVAGDITSWNTAYGWGNHSLVGYLTTELDTLATVTGRGATTTDNITVNGLTVSTDETHTQDLRVGSALFMTDFAPLSGRNFISIGQNGGQAYTVTDNSANWNTAYGWGNHSVQGYITASSADLLTNKSGNISMWTNDVGYITAAGAETDPIYSGDPASGIVAGDITNWDTAYGWGDHSSAGYLTVESDPVFSASTAAGITVGDVSNWNTAYGWGDHSIQGYLTSETDPIFGGAPAAGITNAGSGSVVTATERTNWNNAYGWGDHSVEGYLVDTNNLSDVSSTNTALNNILPTQAGNNGYYLTTDGTNTSWAAVSGGGGSEIFDHGTTAALTAGTVSVTFSSTFTSTPTVTITPVSSYTYSNNQTWPYVSSTTTSGFTITADTFYNGATFNWIAVGQ